MTAGVDPDLFEAVPYRLPASEVDLLKALFLPSTIVELLHILENDLIFASSRPAKSYSLPVSGAGYEPKIEQFLQ